MGFWNLKPCNAGDIYGRVRGNHWFYVEYRRKVDPEGSFKITGTYLPTYRTKQRNIPEEDSINFVTQVQRMRSICVSSNDDVSVHE